MGFFDNFGTVGKYFDARFGGFANAMSDGWNRLYGGAKAAGMGVWDVVTSSSNSKSLGQNLDAFYKGAHDAGTGALEILGSPFELPGMHEVTAGSDKVYRYGVDRPWGTVFRGMHNARVDAEKSGTGSAGYVANLFDGDTWRQAWDDSRNFTVGQSITYNAGELWHGFTDEDAKGWSVRHDPSDALNRKMWSDNPWYKFTSGAIDAALNIEGDPMQATKPLGAMAKNAITPKLKTAKDLEKYQEGGKITRLYDFAQGSRNSEHVRQVVFNDHAHGSTMASILHDVAKEGDRELFNDVFMAAAGDPDAFERITQKNGRLAEYIGRRKAGPITATIASRQGMTPEAVMRVTAINQTATEAFIDALAEGPLYGALRGQALPKVTAAARLRTGLHYRLLYGTPVAVGETLSRSNLLTRLMPTQGYTRFLDAHDPSGNVAAFRGNMERSMLPAERVDYWVRKYGEANTPEARSSVAIGAENDAITAEAARVGMTAEDVDKAMPAINQWRMGQRLIMSQSRKYLPEEARKLADKYAEAGNMAQAKKLAKLLDVWGDSSFVGDPAEKGGGFAKRPRFVATPTTIMSLMDEDGNPSALPIDPYTSKPIKGDELATEPQMADYIPMTDYRAMRSALRWYKWGRPYEPNPVSLRGAVALGARTLDNTRNAALTFADLFNAFWKTAAILRPALPMRSVTDELARRVALYGQTGFLVTTGKGFVHAKTNAVGRAKLRVEYWREKRLERLAEGNETVDIKAGSADHAPHRIAMANSEHGAPPEHAEYGSYPEALAHGAMSTEDYIRQIEHHGAEIGDLDDTDAMLLGSLKVRREMGDKEGETWARRELIKNALAKVGAAEFAQLGWQTSALKELKRHKADGLLVVDPFRGLFSKGANPDMHLDKYELTNIRTFEPSKLADEVPSSQRKRRRGEVGRAPKYPVRIDEDYLYDYIIKHVDEILKPDRMLYLEELPDGKILMSVAKYKGMPKEPIKDSAAYRITNWRRDSQMDAGRTGYKFINNDGSTVSIRAAFDSEHGQRARVSLQSRGPDDNYLWRTTQTEMERIMAASGGWDDITPQDPRYGSAWERAVNRQLANDELAQRALRGDSLDEMLDWAESTKAGRAYVRRMGYGQSDAVRRIAAVKGLVDTLVPHDGSKAGDTLRRKVAEGEARFRHLKSAVGEDGDFPGVHAPTIMYNLGQGAIFNKINKINDNLFKLLMDLPSDKASRIPFFAASYEKHVHNVYRAAATIHASKGKTLSQDEVFRIEKQARGLAMNDVRKFLYDTSTRVDLANATRFVVPFSSAIHDAYTKWARIAIEEPGSIPLLWKYWTTFEKNNMVQDENQNVYHDGKWYSVDPLTHEETPLKPGEEGKDRYVMIRLPSFMGRWMAKNMYGVDHGEAPIRINKDSLNVFLGLPTAGPIVTVPANKFALTHPEFADDKLIRQFVLPYGPTADGGWRQVMPASWRAGWDTFAADQEEGATASGQAMAILQAEMVAYAKGERTKPPTYEEARERASHLRMMRFLSLTVSPASFQVLSPYQPYISAYRTLRAAHPENADELFYQKYGEELWMLTASVTRNVAGVPATVEGMKAYNKYKAMIAEHPELASLIIGAEGAGEFSKSIYEAQKALAARPGSSKRMRQVYDLEDSVADAQRRLIWIKYSRVMGLVDEELARRGLSSINRKGAEDLRAYKARFVQHNQYWMDPGTGKETVSPWYVDYMTSDASVMQRRLDGMRTIVKDPQLRGRNDIGGLVEYLALRRDTKARMAQRNVGRLDNARAEDLRTRFDAQVKNMRLTNPAFGDLWTRWLENDALLEAD